MEEGEDRFHNIPKLTGEGKERVVANSISRRTTKAH
jgi:hypothetical protein